MPEHTIDFSIPNSEWKGYLCPKDGEFHKDGTTQFFHMYCITCGELLKEVH